MRLLFICLFTVLFNCSSIFGAEQPAPPPEIQKQIDTESPIKQYLPEEQPTPADQMPVTTPKEVSPDLQEQLIEKVEKEATKDIVPMTKPDACASLSIEEQSFANRLDPSRKQVFCSKFSTDQRKMSMNMVGKTDSTGTLVTPEQAVDTIAHENDIVLPPVDTPLPSEEATPVTPSTPPEE